MRFIKNIAFFGYADAKPTSTLYRTAFEVARLLTKNGYTIVNGGGPGVMDASTQGATSVGGETLSVTFNPVNAAGFEGRYVRNVTTEEIKTGNYIERMFKLLEHGDVYIIFKGGTGTLSEFATAWCLARLYYGYHKPFILYGEFWNKIISCLKENMYLRGPEDNVYKIVNSPQKVVAAISLFEDDFAKRLGKISYSK